MPSRHLLDPELETLIETWPELHLSDDVLPQIREGRRQMMRDTLPPLPDGVTSEDLFVPGPKGAPDVRVQVTRPSALATGRPAVLHLHGGGYVVGEPDMSRPQCAAWANAFGAVVVSVDYRLAPETIAPGNVEDAYAALAWLFDQADVLGVDRAFVAVAGESAGGGLAAALALLARDRGEYRLCYQHLIFPMLDDRTAVRTDIPQTYGQFIWTRASNRFGWAALLGHEPGREGVSCYAAPARADTLAGLPPTFIATGGLDLFTEENMTYAQRLMGEGVPVEFHIYPGAPHAFMAVPDAAVTRQYARDAMGAMRRGLGRPA